MDNIDTSDTSNITVWFTEKKTKINIFSDYEGTTTTKQIDNFKEIFKNKEYCIYLGDLFDNANFDDKTIDETEPSTCIETKNYCVLQMLKLFVDNPDQCKYVVGNRDINKIKLLPLLQFKDGSKWWQNGNSYEEIVINLIDTFYTAKDSCFKINSMKDYTPFWKYKNNKWDCKNTNWEWDQDQDKPYIEIDNLFDRFNKIFGQDCNKGTMSADYTIRGLPNELFGDSIETIITYIRTKCGAGTNNNNNKNGFGFFSSLLNNDNIKIEQEIRAAIVFTVFMRMLDKPKSQTANTNTSINKLTYNEFGDLDSYLYTYLIKAYPALYAIYEDNLYLFAHGGITEKFCETNIDTTAFALLDKVIWTNVFDITKKINTQTTATPAPAPAPAPALESTPDQQPNVIEKIKEFNSNYKQKLDNIFDTYNNSGTVNNNNKTENKYDKDLLVLLSLSAGVEQNEIIKDTKYTSDLSPIQPKLPINQLLNRYVIDKNIKTVYNICGHASSGIGGYGYKEHNTVKEHNTDKEHNTEEVYKTIFINTDYSTSLFKSTICKEKTNYNNNYLMLYFDNTKNMFLSGEINFNFEQNTKNTKNTKNNKNNKNNKNSNFIIFSPTKSNTSTKKITYEIQPFIPDNYVEDYKKIISIYESDEKYSELKKIVFNGNGTIGGVSYRIYSCFTFDKNIFWGFVNNDKPTVGGYHNKNKNKRKHLCKNKTCKKCNSKFSISKYKFINNKKSKKYKNKYTKKN